MSKKNLGLDFVKAKGRGILPSELTHYCAWRGVSDANKTKLHNALLSPAMGAQMRVMRYWNKGQELEAKFYMDIFWNLDEVTNPDIEGLLKRDLDLFCSYAPFLAWKDDGGNWHNYESYPM